MSDFYPELDHTPEGKPTKEEAEVLGLERVNKLLQANNWMLYEQAVAYKKHAKLYQGYAKSFKSLAESYKSYAESYKSYAESYKTHCGHRCHRCPVNQVEMISGSALPTLPLDEVVTTSSENILKKYFSGD